MSRTTNTEWRTLFLYQVYVRSHSQEGTFKAFNKDLDHIKDLGTDVVYFMPIHPIGEKGKKGSLGCPYSIYDYRGINPEYGTLEDFQETVQEIHKRGMKVMIDVVFNHTSNDSVLLQEHPEYFLYENGSLVRKEPGWSDVQDFDYSVTKDLWDELVDVLFYWMDHGVDGFRFDVTSFLPFEFLEYAGKAMRIKNPDVILLSESVHGGYCRYMRNKGYEVLSESEVYQVFDMAYDYDVQPYFLDYLTGKGTLNRFLEEILRQEEIYPKNYIKMRNLENHDNKRIANLVHSNPVIDNWTAFIFFMKGSTMIYEGEEYSATHLPSLFEQEVIERSGRDISTLIKTMAKLVKTDHFVSGVFDIHVQELDVVVSTYQYKGETVVGIFNVGAETGSVSIPVKSGTYTNLIDRSDVQIKKQSYDVTDKPVLFIVK